MKPVVTVAEMRAFDANASVTEDVLIHRAGWAVARKAKQMLGGTYGKRVVIVAGKGNNGADARVAGEVLSRSGVRVRVLAPGEAQHISDADLVIDGAFGTGFTGDYKAPETNAPVLAVDIASGVDGDTGVACDGAVVAHATVCLAGLKPGHLLADGPKYCGTVKVVDIGLDVSSAKARLIELADVQSYLPALQRESHKWKAAVTVIAGSPGMMGAAMFAVSAAQRSGAGMVRLGSPGVSKEDLPAGEAVSVELPAEGWDAAALIAAERSHAIVVGPGLGREDATTTSVKRLVSSSELPLVIDGDGLYALSDDIDVLAERRAPTLLTPHEGEFQRLAGAPVSAERISDVERLAERVNATVLLKGSTTIVATPGESTLLSASGSARLATAGSGDVLSGIIGAFVAMGVSPHMAAACGAFVHGESAKLGYARGLVAGDLPELVAQWLSNNGATE